MAVTCLVCGDEIDIGTVGDRDDDGEVHLTVSARLKFRDSWASYGRLHVDCAEETIGAGEFDPREWAAEVRE